MKKTLLLAMGLILLGSPAAFATILLDQSGALGTVFQQTFDNPCVIGDSSCKQPTVGSTPNHFDFTVFSGTPDVSWDGNTTAGSFSGTPGQYDLTSPVPFNAAGIAATHGSFDDDNGPYLASNTVTGVGFVNGQDAIPLSFTMGIDVNMANTKETLVAFNTWVSDTGADGTWSLDGANSFQTSTLLNGLNNGNGFSDAILTGFSLTDGKFYFFEAKYAGDKDGMEQFFLVPAGSPAVPEPGTLLFLGAGLVGIAVTGRRMKK